MRGCIPSRITEEKKKEILQKLWAEDPSIFSDDPQEKTLIAHRLGWLKAPYYMKEKVSSLKDWVQKIKKNFDMVIHCGMGGSSLFPLALKEIFSSQEGFPKLFVLDSTDPEEISFVERNYNPSRTLFIIASKSGSTVETNAHFLYFWEKLSSQGVEPGKHFVAITDEGSPLHKKAQELKFTKIFLNPSNLGGRYAALTFVGLVPGALMGLKIEKFLRAAEKMLEESNPQKPWGINPSAWLSEFLAENFFEGRDKLFLLVNQRLLPFAFWIEQLVAESLGKKGKGIIPIIQEDNISLPPKSSDKMFMYLSLKDHRSSAPSFLNSIKENTFSLRTYWLNDLYDIGAECIRWEIAIALTGIWLGINPFNEPDVIRAKEKTKQVLHFYKEKGHFPIELFKAQDFDCQFQYSLGTAEKFFSLKEALERFFCHLSSKDYIAFLPYLPYNPEIKKIIQQMGKYIQKRYSCSTILGFGPRYLHSTGQLFKGGPNNGNFLIFTRETDIYQKIPSLGYSFRDLQRAQAYGDFQALEELGKKVIYIHLPEKYLDSLKVFSLLLKDVVEKI